MEKKELNHIVKEKIKEVEHKIVPGVQWNKENSWNKIKDILNSKNKQLIMWYFATAASVSVLVAATLDETLPILEQFIPKAEVVEVAARHTDKNLDVVADDTQARKDFVISSLKSKEIQREAAPGSPVKVCSFEEFNIHPTYPEVLETEQKSQSKLPIDINIHANANQLSGISPGISFQYRYVLKSNSQKTQYLSLGTYTNFIFSSASEQNSERFYPATFINAAYGQQKHQDRKAGWEIGAGYLLNPNQVLYKDTTLRFHYTRTVMGRIKVGPELILTNNLTKVFPGFTLAFG